jgi:predicted signal transduction protein with EAL and GGDEF domain
LIKASRAIEAGLRQSDTLARLGGDEFAILLDDIDVDSRFLTLIDRVQERLSQPIRLQESEIVVTASIGVALSDNQYQHAAEILRDADSAMYKAKANGRATYQIYSYTIDTQVSELLRIENELRHALAHDELQAYFQPIVDLRDHRLIGFEALIRWEHPLRGLLQPADFLAIAEESGLIVKVGRWLLTHACRQLSDWRRQNPRFGEIFVTVNLSGREFVQPDLIEAIQEALRRFGLPTRCLRLEITESVLTGNPERARIRLQEFKNIGIELFIDDFGADNSSFDYLLNYPFDVLKIDRSFIERLERKGNAHEIIRAMIELVHRIGMRVVAEGGEDRETMDTLRELGCEFAQAYHFSRPLPPKQLEDWVRTMEAS